ncbi:MAG: ATP synthase subunit I [Candidatus Cohnella colombiensis]|uniref:ATP synthase subunit I n=1 Tax=Candidatus Cohnella colombiensis TaxID=3121368 RepID=A0AA95EZ10_9BACL|nr:MAG: ATP synthase subunit I [Cohnella sp.]
MKEDVPTLLRRMTRMTFFFLSLCCVGLAVWPDYKPYFGGFIIGAIGSLLGSYHLAWKTTRIGLLAADGRKSRSGFGYLARAAIGLLAAIISVRQLDFELTTTIAGLLALPLVTLLLGLFTIRRPQDGHSADERGEK